jgi:hypothetical protein
MTQQEKLIVLGLLAALLLGAVVRTLRRHQSDLPHPSLKRESLSP